MICPLISQPARQGSVENLTPVTCKEDECAWWHARDKACSMLLLADAATLMQGDLNAIAGSMPQ